MPKVVDRESFRAELALRCFKLFASQGLRAVTTRQLAAELGVSTGTLYHYFGGKRALFEHMVTQTIEQHIRHVEAIPRKASVEERATTLLGYVEDNEEAMRSLLFVIVDYLRLETERADEFFESMLLQFVPAIMGVLDLEDATVAEALVAYVDGLLIRRAAMSHPMPLSEHAMPVVRMLVGYMQSVSTSE